MSARAHPIGSVLVLEDASFGSGHNRRVQRGSAILHGERTRWRNADAAGRRVSRMCALHHSLTVCHVQRYVVLYASTKVIIGRTARFAARGVLRSRGVRWRWCRRGVHPHDARVHSEASTVVG